MNEQVSDDYVCFIYLFLAFVAGTPKGNDTGIFPKVKKKKEEDDVG